MFCKVLLLQLAACKMTENVGFDGFCLTTSLYRSGKVMYVRD